jgi:uncharacterized protein DUF5335
VNFSFRQRHRLADLPRQLSVNECCSSPRGHRALLASSSGRDNGHVTQHPKSWRPDLVHERPKEDWHRLLDELTLVRAGDDITIELLDAEFGDGFEAEGMPLAYAEYDEHADEASVAVGGRDGRYPVVLRHSIPHPTSILTDSKPPMLPLVVQIVGADGSETLVTVLPRVEEG